MPQKTLISHIFNEEHLLPSWLTHHKKLFDHGIILDTGCTDRSTQIINEICPTWEIIKVDPQNTGTPRLDIDIVQQVESRLSGWKCTLNVSEYLIVDNLDRYITEFEKNSSDIGFMASGLILVDRMPNSLEFFDDLNLIKKMDFGYIEKGKAWNGIWPSNGQMWPTDQSAFFKSRLIHKNVHGEYTGGRHNTRLNVKFNTDIFIAWVGRGSPIFYNKRLKSWNTRTVGVPLNGRGGYEMSIELCYNFWETERSKAQNIFEIAPKYKEYIDALYN